MPAPGPVIFGAEGADAVAGWVGVDFAAARLARSLAAHSAQKICLAPLGAENVLPQRPQRIFTLLICSGPSTPRGE
jgi:hypothetical protein